MPMGLAVTVHAVVVPHPTDGETGVCERWSNCPSTPGHTGRAPLVNLTGAHTTQQALPLSLPQAGADSGPALPP